MAVVMHLPELISDPDSRFNDPAFVADLYADRLRFAVSSWSEVLAMAVRDGAASVHYHPWRMVSGRDDSLSYIVGGVRYGLLPPDAESGRRLLAEARRLAAPGSLARFRAWASGHAVGRLRLVAASGESEWLTVFWGRDRWAGVEFLRLSPVAESVGNPEAEPVAAPDRRTSVIPSTDCWVRGR